MQDARKNKLKANKAVLLGILILSLFVDESEAAEKEVLDDNILVVGSGPNKPSAYLLAVSSQNSKISGNTPKKPSDCFSDYFTSSFSCLLSSFKTTSCLEEREEEKKPRIKIGNSVPQSVKKSLNLPAKVILTIASFLDYPDQLELSHVNKEFRNVLNETFWEEKILSQDYMLWDTPLPRAKIFFANYFYDKGFGRDPKLPEKVAIRREDITLFPNLLLAEKALAPGFPKGKQNYQQVKHKMTMSKIVSEYGTTPTFNIHTPNKMFFYND